MNLSATLRSGRNVSQRPSRWDQIVVPQMGGVYDIVMPGRYPDDFRKDSFSLTDIGQEIKEDWEYRHDRIFFPAYFKGSYTRESPDKNGW